MAQASNKILSNTFGANAAANGLKAFSGSNVHNLVLEIGYFFGKKFKPWEAVKWGKGIDAAGKALGVFAVVFSLGMQVKEDIDDDKQQQEMRNNREKLRVGFSNAANEVVKHFNEALSNYVSKDYLSRVSEIDLQISEIRSMRIGKSETCKFLESAQSECKSLIADIHKNCSDESNDAELTQYQ